MSFGQMTTKTLNALKGWPNPAALDFHTEFDPSVTVDVPPGAVVRLNNSGRYVLGVGNNRVMPLFVFAGSKDPDVVNPSGNPATDRGVFVPISPTGQALTLVATGGYELVSTHFVPGTYTPNTPLTSPATGPDAGKLAPGTMYTNMIVGLVSRGEVDNGYGTRGLAFWPCPVFPTT